MISGIKIKIFSRQEIVDFLKNSFYFPNTVLISITDPDSPCPIPEELLSRVEDYIQVKFWDVEKEIYSSHTGIVYRPINEKTAEKIVRFILKNRDRVFLVHCNAGISRSPAVALAIVCILRDGGDRRKFALEGCSEIIGNPGFSPNWAVFDRIVEAFWKIQKQNSQDSVKLNSRHNSGNTKKREYGGV